VKFKLIIKNDFTFQIQVQPSVDFAPVPTSSQEIDPQQSASADVLVGHVVPKETNKMEACYKESLENMEAKLSAAEEEKLRIKEELQEMFEKYSKLEEHLQEKKAEEISYEDHYNQLQEKHKLELEDLRKAGHDALSIIIEEFKALTKSAVQQQQEASKKQLQSAIENQMQKCEELLNTQDYVTVNQINQLYSSSKTNCPPDSVAESPEAIAEAPSPQQQSKLLPPCLGRDSPSELSSRPVPKPPAVHWPDDVVPSVDAALPPPPPLPAKKHSRRNQVMSQCVSFCYHSVKCS
ncbi:hypothetical protein scyTo_0018609, partial [Scyliorhinus torazame]|nr:hypothetical protein [Scyliorhinus torazame]